MSESGASRSTPASDKLDAFGIDALCEHILDGVTLTDVAEKVGVSIGTLLTWRDADTERSARAKQARTKRAEMWDELAITEIRAATDALGLGKAKEIAHHYRWRASKIAPADYGDRTTIAGDPAAPLYTAAVTGLGEP